NLDALVEKKTFRADLYFRINTVVLEIPPLRERPDDLTPLAKLFLGQIALELDREPMRLTSAALEKLRAHRWPGNIRELRNALERAGLLAHGPEVGPGDFSFEPAPSTGAASAAGDGSLLETEKDLIRKTLEAERGRVGRAAESLGISRSSLYQKIRTYGIVVSRN
ncbi:MAG: AAA-type ATPase lid domain-containing protein, partial [Thermoanaerobaculia bacterium]